MMELKISTSHSEYGVAFMAGGGDLFGRKLSGRLSNFTVAAGDF